MISKSDKGPGRSRPPSTKQTRTSSTSGGGGDGGGSWRPPCLPVILIPLLGAAVTVSLLATGVVR